MLLKNQFDVQLIQLTPTAGPRSACNVPLLIQSRFIQTAEWSDFFALRCRYHSNLRLPLIYPHPYRQITVETEFDNPLYETGGVSAITFDTTVYRPSPHTQTHTRSSNNAL